MEPLVHLAHPTQVVVVVLKVLRVVAPLQVLVDQESCIYIYNIL
jgi:hypothetical protein